MMQSLRRLLGNKEGATAVEYGIMVAAIAAVIITTVFTVGEQVVDGFTTVSDNMTTAGMTTTTTTP